MRVYLLTKYRISKRVDLWIKIAQTQYQNISTIGSGLDLINSAGKTDVKAQVRIALGKR